MKIYTGTGDRGKTSLFSGERIEKSDHRIDAYGDVDELNAALGMLSAMAPEGAAALRGEIAQIQSHLFHVGARLATTTESPQAGSLVAVDDAMTRFIEEAIDRMESGLPPLAHFVVPGGHPAAACAHVARTVCRRTERKVVRLARSESRPEAMSGVLVYLNRLSDYLFVVSRHLNHTTGHGDSLWRP
jgi:cob(I)alamin adenosyltransferase